MAETFRIEIPVEVQNKTEPGVGQVEKKLTGLERSARNTRKQMEQMNQTKFQMLGAGLTKTMNSLNNVRRTLFSMTGRTWRIGLSVASAPFRMLSSLAHTLLSLPTILTAVGTGFAAKFGIFDPLKFADQLQRAQITFKTFLGSQQAGNDFFRQLQVFGAKTPFETDTLQRYATQLLPVFNGNTKMVMRTLKAFGDTASLTGQNLDNMDLALYGFRQIAGSDKLRMQDLRQVTENLLLPMTAVQKELGLTGTQMADLGKQGIPASKAIDAILRAMERPVNQGGFLGGMAAMMDTLGGQMSYLRDGLKISLYTRWANGLKSVALPALKNLNTWFENNGKTVDHWGDKLEHAGHTVGTWMVNRVKGLQSAFTALTTSQAWKNATTFGQKMGVAWDFLQNGFESWWAKNQGSVLKGFGNVGGFLGGALKGGVMAALGILDPSDKLNKDQSPFVTAGAQAGKSFFDEFMKQLDVGAIGKRLGSVVMPSADKSLWQNILGGAVGLFGGAFLYKKGKALWDMTTSPFKDLYKGAKKLRNTPWTQKGFGKPISSSPIESTPSKILGPNGKSIGEYRPPNLKTPETSLMKKAPYGLDSKLKPTGSGSAYQTPKGLSGWISRLPKWVKGVGVGLGLPMEILGMYQTQQWLNEHGFSGKDMQRNFGTIFSTLNTPSNEKYPFSSLFGITKQENIPVSQPRSQVFTIHVNANPSYNIETAANADEVMTIVYKNEKDIGNMVANAIANVMSGAIANSP